MPNFTGGAGVSLVSLAAPIVKGVVFLAVFILLNRRIIPRAQYWIASHGNKELFLIGTIVFCLAMAVLSNAIGLSLALGAFVAGLIVSESDFNYQILAGITPFRDAFLCIFFVTLGMLLDPLFVVRHPGQVLLLFLAIVAVKFLLAGLAMAVSGYTLRTALLAGAGLAQVGEFSFIILKMGLDGGLVAPDLYNLFLSSSLITMVVTPYVLSGVPAFMHLLVRIKPMEKILYGRDDPDMAALQGGISGHVVICGYGPIGRTIGRALKQKDVPFVALDLNARTVATMKKLDVNIFFGDASSPEVLRKVRADKARLVVVTTPDRMSGEQIIKNMKHLNPDCFILVRSHFSRESEDYYDFGADSVVQEEFEAGLRMLSTALGELGVPAREIEEEVATVRIERDDLTRIKYFGSLNFSSNISAARIVMDMAARSKEEAFRELVAVAALSPKVRDKEEFYKRVLEREEISNTGLGNGIAIPHARTATIEDVIITLGISRKGIDYGAADARPARIIILFGVNEDAPDLYLKTLASVASVLDDEAFIRDITQCADANRLIRLIQEREKKIARPAPAPADAGPAS
jgi:CPA2 family monovalent cation:H+ antiporter-2